MLTPVTLGFDVGTSSSKGVLVTLDGCILRSATCAHVVDRPLPGHVEMSGDIWWQEFVDITNELTLAGDVEVVAIGVSGMGPCVLITDGQSRPLRPAILYGVDTRATAQISALNEALKPPEILDRCGSALSSQAVGPKLAWLREHEPIVFAQAKRLYMPSSWLVHMLTGAYVLDYHSASQCTPMFDAGSLSWHQPWADLIAPEIELPPLKWTGEQAGVTQQPIAGIAAGVPVITGTIDAWSEALSVGAHNVGDLMLMYGTTMFLINTLKGPITSESMWGTVGALEGTRSLAGGMATSGAITSWLRELVGSPDYVSLLTERDPVRVHLAQFLCPDRGLAQVGEQSGQPLIGEVRADPDVQPLFERGPSCVDQGIEIAVDQHHCGAVQLAFDRLHDAAHLIGIVIPGGVGDSANCERHWASHLFDNRDSAAAAGHSAAAPDPTKVTKFESTESSASRIVLKCGNSKRQYAHSSARADGLRGVVTGAS